MNPRLTGASRRARGTTFGGRGIVPLLLVTATFALAAVGCGADASDLTSTAAPSGEDAADALDPLAMSIRAADDGSAVLVDDGATLHVLDPASAAERFAAPGAIASGDGAVVVGAAPTSEGAVVVARSVLDGSTRWSAAVSGPLEVVGVSRGGETVALVDPSTPEGSTTVVIVRFAFVAGVPSDDPANPLPPGLASAPLPSSQRYELAGELEFDGFADSTLGLFVLQRSEAEEDAYKVRWLDLMTGVIADMSTRDKDFPEGEMYGRFRSAVTIPTRSEVATLYTVEGSGSSGAAFVHLLNTGGIYADCLDLPLPLGRGEPSTLAIAVPAMGNPILVYDSVAGSVAALDPANLGSVLQVELDEPALAQGGPAALAVGPDNHVYVASGDLVVVYELSAVEVRRWSPGGQITALTSIPGAGRFAALVDGSVRIFELDGTLVAGGSRGPEESEPPAAPPAAPPGAPPAAVVPAPVPPSTVADLAPASTVAEPVDTVPGTALTPGTSRP